MGHEDDPQYTFTFDEYYDKYENGDMSDLKDVNISFGGTNSEDDDEKDEINSEIFAEINYHAGYQPMRSMRTTRWKYIRHFSDYAKKNVINVEELDLPGKEILSLALLRP